MLIHLHPFGRLGNRLFLAAHLIAFSKKFNTPLLNLAIGEYATLFPWMEGNAAMAFPWAQTGNLKDARRAALLNRVEELLPWSHRYRCWKGGTVDFDHQQIPGLLDPLQQGKKVFFQGWLFRGYESVQRYHQDIVEVFRFPEDVKSRAESFLAQLRQRFDRVIGVHVRWEDYRGTEHFLEPQAFRDRMDTLKALWPDEKIGFLLFSNETLDGALWTGESLVCSPSLSVSSDLAMMALCDQLIGPPSTFSAWASFTGRVPLANLRREQPALVAADFQVFPG